MKSGSCIHMKYDAKLYHTRLHIRYSEKLSALALRCSHTVILFVLLSVKTLAH